MYLIRMKKWTNSFVFFFYNSCNIKKINKTNHCMLNISWNFMHSALCTLHITHIFSIHSVPWIHLWFKTYKTLIYFCTKWTPMNNISISRFSLSCASTLVSFCCLYFCLFLNVIFHSYLLGHIVVVELKLQPEKTI